MPEPFATVEDLERRLGRQLAEGPERDRAEALLEDASNLIRAVARGGWREGFLPDVIPTICINVAMRAFLNPDGQRSQTVGDTSVSYANADGLALTADERRLIRIAAGFGVELDSIQLESGYETLSTIFVPTEPPGDWVPFRSVPEI